MKTSSPTPITFTIDRQNRAPSAQMEEALKDLPHIAQLASKDTSWPIQGHIQIKVSTPQTMLTDMRKAHEGDPRIPGKFNQIKVKIAHFKPFSSGKFKEVHGLAHRNQATNQNFIVINDIKGLSADVIKHSLYHELIHIGQFQNHPDSYKEIQKLGILHLVSNNVFGHNSTESNTILNTLNKKYLKIFEGQATRLNEIHDNHYFPNQSIQPAEKKPNFISAKINLVNRFEKNKLGNPHKEGAAFFADKSVVAPDVNRHFIIQLSDEEQAIISKVEKKLDEGKIPFRAPDISLNPFSIISKVHEAEKAHTRMDLGLK
ncbi:MAG TPA: hypothetical protein DHW71_00670 [Gammaproteobacteria bacterium]|nr:hypothetical protein [Gammaproteobacteria bacterium]HBF08097.1 hypothetical protein [Gammaproteobacteria bacterium]HCK91461.1 hypothetical protein [Gammaproteobacteria bacterium]|tara:strand:- start:86210 stop:87157 length:948 start_codon:yes stop_codon:yes gene_type:complete